MEGSGYGSPFDPLRDPPSSRPVYYDGTDRGRADVKSWQGPTQRSSYHSGNGYRAGNSFWNQHYWDGKTKTSKTPSGQSNIDGASAKAKGIAGKIGAGALGWGAIDVAFNLHAGDDFGTAAAKGLGTTLLWSAAQPVMWAHLGATTAIAGHQAYRDFKKQRVDWWNKQFSRGTVGGGYQDTQRAMTMRQAAVQAIQGSKLNARSALGGEAKILSGNYHRG